MEELKARLLTDDFGKHLMGVEDLLQKHNLLEADINILGERVKGVAHQSQRFVDVEGSSAEGYRPCDPSLVLDRVQQLEDAYAELVSIKLVFLTEIDTTGKISGECSSPKMLPKISLCKQFVIAYSEEVKCSVINYLLHKIN